MNHGAEGMRIHQSSTRTTLLAASLLLACVPLAQANGVDAAQEATPAAAATPQQAQALPEPQMALQTQASFVLKGVQFVGATGVPDSELQAAVADRIGTSVTFADLEQLAARAAAVYKQRGFSLVQAFVPVQEVVDGVVKITISEGVLGNLNIDVAEGAPVSQERVARTLAVLEPGKPLNGMKYERAMLLLSDLPGIKPQSAIGAGAIAAAVETATRRK